MTFSMNQRRVLETMPTGRWNDFTDLPVEFISHFQGGGMENKKLSCYYSPSFIYYATMMDDILIFTCLLATFVNFIVILCSAKLYNEKGDTLHLFIFNMTVGDIILTLFCHPYELVTRRYHGANIHAITVFLNFANWIGLAVSGLSLTLLNVDKLIFFCWPFKYDIWMSYFRAKLFCCLTWLISIGFATYYWIYSYVYFAEKTIEIDSRLEIQYVLLTVFMNGERLSPLNKVFYEAFTIIFCVIPIVSSLLVSCYLYDLTKRKRKLTIINNMPSKNEHKATSFAFIFATTLWTSCSLLPYRLANLARIHVITWPTLECESKQMWSWFTWSMLYLLILNPIINPLITAFAYAPYRQTIFSIGNKKSYFHQVQIYFMDFIFKAGKDKHKKVVKRKKCLPVYSIEILERSTELENSSISAPKAPLAKLPSICSCGSLVTSETLECTRF